VSTAPTKTTDSSEAGASKAYSLVPIPPLRFDKYTLIGKLGHGGMAEVNLAVVEGKGGFRKLVVVKRLHRHLSVEPGFIDMFLDEARLAARLNHPHCVQTHEVGEFDGGHFLAMEYLDGQGLERLLRMSGQKGVPVPIDLAVRIITDALDGLAYAHELTDFDGTALNVVHRDVSPQNIFITYNGVVKLLDFGIAKAATHVVETRTGVIKGKYAYIAPEQALAQDVDHRADLWSMGVVFWEVLTGRRLFKSVNELATLHETLQGEIKLPSAFRPEIPPEIDTICMRALERDVKLRYQTAAEMKEDIDRYIASLEKGSNSKHIGRLMRDRFGDVIEQHKTVLAQCLKAGEVGMTMSGIQRLVEQPMTTPTGSFPAQHLSGQSMTPTPSGEYVALAAPAAAPVIAHPTAEPEKKSSGVIWKIAVVCLVIGIAGAAALLVPWGGDDDEVGTQIASNEQTTSAPDEEPGSGTNEHPGPAEQRQPDQVAAEPVEPDPPPQADPAEAQPAVVAPVAAEPAAADARERLRRERLRRQQGEQPQTQPPQNNPPPPQQQEPANNNSSAPGFLTLATTPWTRVQLGGRDLGTTPIMRIELPAGTHTLHLSNPEQGIDQTYRVTIEPGQTITRRLGLR
jgi:serine/threonine protein kinase